MSDIEYLTDLNQRRARERELGQRWDEIVAARKKQRRAKETAVRTCFTSACISLGAAATYFGLGWVKEALIMGGVALICFIGAAVFSAT